MPSKAKNRRPQQGWIYTIDPHQIVIECKAKHRNMHDLVGVLPTTCPDCGQEINPCRVFRYRHPHIVWSSDELTQSLKSIETFVVIPMTSQERYTGLPSVYPITPSVKNGLKKKSYALTHQIYTVDANHFKDLLGGWRQREGQIDKKDKQGIGECIEYTLGCPPPGEDWFRDNASREMLDLIWPNLSQTDREKFLSDKLEEL